MKPKIFGFTLIELLVVISIIGLLSTVLFASFEESRKQSRDKVRMTTLKEMQLAIELYKAQFGVYPAGGCNMHQEGRAWVSPGPFDTGMAYGDGAMTGTLENCPNFIVGLVPDFLPSLPTERSVAMNVGFRYAVSLDRTRYKLLSHVTVESVDVTTDSEFYRCPIEGNSCTNGTFCRGDFGGFPTNLGLVRTYAVYSPGAECW